jgi:hypothetical protein
MLSGLELGSAASDRQHATMHMMSPAIEKHRVSQSAAPPVPTQQDQHAHLIKNAGIFKTVGPCSYVNYGPRITVIAAPSCQQLHVLRVSMPQRQFTVQLIAMQQRGRQEQQA